MRLETAGISLATLAALLAAAPRARAQDNAATVEALFDAGKKLVADGKVAEACPKFLASYTLDHRIGTVLNLADCYERNGQFASAWARFVEAATLAQRAGQPERVAFASQHAKELEAKLSTLVVTVSSAVAGMSVTRDGIAVDPGAYGVAVPVDGGTHAIKASAPGMKPWSGDIQMQTSGDHQSLAVPALVPEPAPVAAAAPAPAAPAAPAASGSPTRRYIGLGTVGAGVVGLAVGTAFGVMAIGKNHDSTPDCGLGGNPNGCNGAGVALRSTAVSDGTISTVFIGLGAAAVIGGGVLWLTSGSSKPGTTVGFDGRSFVVSGRF